MTATAVTLVEVGLESNTPCVLNLQWVNRAPDKEPVTWARRLGDLTAQKTIQGKTYHVYVPQDPHDPKNVIFYVDYQSNPYSFMSVDLVVSKDNSLLLDLFSAVTTIAATVVNPLMLNFFKGKANLKPTSDTSIGGGIAKLGEMKDGNLNIPLVIKSVTQNMVYEGDSWELEKTEVDQSGYVLLHFESAS